MPLLLGIEWPPLPSPCDKGSPGMIEDGYAQAGYRDVYVRVVPFPLRLSSATECVRFERESFGALHQMMSRLYEAEREDTWLEIERELRQFEGHEAFEGPCEMLVAVGTK